MRLDVRMDGNVKATKPKTESLLPWMSVIGLVAIVFGLLWSMNQAGEVGAPVAVIGSVLFVGGLTIREIRKIGR